MKVKREELRVKFPPLRRKSKAFEDQTLVQGD